MERISNGMFDSQDYSRRKFLLEEPSEEWRFDVRDKIANDTAFEAEQENPGFSHNERLLRFITEHCAANPRACLPACRYFRTMNESSHQKKLADVISWDMLFVHEEQVLAYLSKSLEISPEETALTYELLEASWFSVWSWKFTPVRKRLPDGPRLEYFRMAQRIREEFGITRRSSASPCFESFEEITQLEKELAEDEPVNFMLQCVATKEDAAVGHMFYFIRTLPQLESFRQEIARLGRLDENAMSCCTIQFETLVEESGCTPMWSQMKYHLDRSSEFFLGAGTLLEFDAGISSEELDEALLKVSNYLLRCFYVMDEVGRAWRNSGAEVKAAALVLKLLLNRGGNLAFRDPLDTSPGGRSTLGALLELADLVPVFPIAEFLPYICCPLRIEGRVLKLNEFHPARLSCLAARSVGARQNFTRLPNNFRAWIRMHRDLLSGLGVEL